VTRDLRLQGILTRSLEPEVRAQILSEVHYLRFDEDSPISVAHSVRALMTWLPNVPVCKACGAVMSTSVYRFERETSWVADPSTWTGFRPSPGPGTFCYKVERYACARCHAVRMVSRESDPLAILRTRTGRCGEYAILYTSVLLALGHQARLLVTEQSDHVWTEVRIAGTWVPVDASAEDPERLIKDRLLFHKWGWKLDDLTAIEPGKVPMLVGGYTP
jgi:hypothetical protein